MSKAINRQISQLEHLARRAPINRGIVAQSLALLSTARRATRQGEIERAHRALANARAYLISELDA